MIAPKEISTAAAPKFPVIVVTIERLRATDRIVGTDPRVVIEDYKMCGSSASTLQ